MGKATKNTKTIGDYTKAELLAELKKHEAKAKEPAKVYIDGLTGEAMPYFKRLEVNVNGAKIRTFVNSDAFWKAHKKGKSLTEKANA